MILYSGLGPSCMKNVKTAANIYHFQACNSLGINGVISVRADWLRERLYNSPSPNGIIRCLPTTLPESSRNRSGSNCCGWCQSSGSMCALSMFNNTCITIRHYSSIWVYTRSIVVSMYRLRLAVTHSCTQLDQFTAAVTHHAYCRP